MTTRNLEDLQGEDYWKDRPINDAKRDWGDKTTNWVTDYSQSRKHSHRGYVVREILRFQPQSVLEIGCNSGPNLQVIDSLAPSVSLSGIDINEDSINEAKLFLTNADLRVGSILKLPFENNAFDVTLADAVLMYIDPQKIKEVTDEMDRVTKKGIVIVDWHDEDVLGTVKDWHWARNYKLLLQYYGFDVEMISIDNDIWPTKTWKANGYIYVARRTKNKD